MVAGRPLPQSNLRESVDIGLALFRGVGYRVEDIPLAADTMITYTLGFIVQEAGHRSNRAEFGEVEGEQRAEVLRHMDELPLDATMQRRMLERRLDLQASLDEQFETGLRAMRRGLRDGLGHEEPAPSRTAPDQPGGRGGT